ncbi:MAG: hypothetical protein Q9212_001567 [Teloschistes hypoglaucus]
MDTWRDTWLERTLATDPKIQDIIRREFEKTNPGQVQKYSLEFKPMGGQDMHRVTFNDEDGWAFTLIAEKGTCLSAPVWSLDWPENRVNNEKGFDDKRKVRDISLGPGVDRIGDTPAPEEKTAQDVPSADDGKPKTRGQKKRAAEKRKKQAVKDALTAQASSAAEASSAAQESQPANASADTPPPDTTTAATAPPVENIRDFLSEGAGGFDKIRPFMDRIKDPKQAMDELVRAEKAGEEVNLANIDLLDEAEKGTAGDGRWAGLGMDHEFLIFLKDAPAPLPKNQSTMEQRKAVPVAYWKEYCQWATRNNISNKPDSGHREVKRPYLDRFLVEHLGTMGIFVPAGTEASWLYRVKDGEVIWDEARLIHLIDEKNRE